MQNNQSRDSNDRVNPQADSYLPTDWPVKDSQIAEVAAVHGIGNLSNDYNKLKAELKAKLKAEKKKPHEVINYGVHNEHPSHPYDFTKNPVEDSYDTPKNPVKDSYDTPKNPVNDPFRTPPPPSFGVPGKEPHLFGSPPQFKDSYSKPPPRPQPTYDIPKETYTHPKEEVKHPSYSVPPPPKGGYAALPKPPIGEIIDSYPHSYPHEVHEVPVYSPTGPPMPQMYYDSIPDYREVQQDCTPEIEVAFCNAV